MTVLFKHFVTEEFKKLLSEIHKLRTSSEADRMSIWRLTNKYNEEVATFGKRWNEIVTESQEEIKALPDGDEKITQIQQESSKKLEELLNCVSEIKKLDYNAIKELSLSAADLDVLKPVLINFPEELDGNHAA